MHVDQLYFISLCEHVSLDSYWFVWNPFYGTNDYSPKGAFRGFSQWLQPHLPQKGGSRRADDRSFS